MTSVTFHGQAMRADRYLVDNGHFETRAKAQEAIAAGKVVVNGQVLTKPSQKISDGAEVKAEPAHPWVSRAALKLVAALGEFGIDPAGRVCLDVGSSTGGFTQVLLSRGARQVYAVDVGRDQKMTELTQAALTDVVRRFPETEYAKDATLKLDMVRDQLAGKEMEIGRWYLRRHDHLAAINRFRTVVEVYDGTSHVPEARHRLVEAYLSIGLKGEAQAVGAVLGYNFPESEWYEDSYALLTNEGLDPGAAPEREGWLSRLF